MLISFDFVFFFPQVEVCQLAKPWVSSSFKLKSFRGKKAVAPDWFCLQKFLGYCESNILSDSANKCRPPHFIYFIWENSVKNNLIGIYFRVTHVLYIFFLELFVMFDQKPTMLPIVTNISVIVVISSKICVLISNVTLGFTCCRIQTRIESIVCNEFSDNSFKRTVCIMCYK